MTEARDAAPDGASGGKPIRLPVWRLLVVSFASVLAHPGNFIRRAWMSMALTLAMLIFAHMVPSEISFHPFFSVFIVASVLLIVCSWVLMAVNWHRGLLAGDPPPQVRGIRLDRRFWRFVGVILFACVVFIPVIGLVALFFNAASALRSFHLIWPVMTAALVFSLVVWARLLIAFPLVAIDQSDVIATSIKITSGNTWRLMWLLVLTNLPYQVITNVLNNLHVMGIQIAGNAFIGTGLSIFSMIVFLISIAIIASLASYSYAILTGHPLAKEVTR